MYFDFLNVYMAVKKIILHYINKLWYFVNKNVVKNILNKNICKLKF